jgi:hypothetical protein
MISCGTSVAFNRQVVSFGAEAAANLHLLRISLTRTSCPGAVQAWHLGRHAGFHKVLKSNVYRHFEGDKSASHKLKAQAAVAQAKRDAESMGIAMRVADYCIN